MDSITWDVQTLDLGDDVSAVDPPSHAHQDSADQVDAREDALGWEVAAASEWEVAAREDAFGWGEHEAEKVEETPASVDPEKMFNIMALTPEVRANILKYLPETTYVAVFLGGRYGAPTKVKLHPIVRAGDKLLRRETIKLTIEMTTWSVHSFEGNKKFTEWLSFVDLKLTSKNYVSGFDAVKSLDFPYFSRFPHRSFAADTLNSDIELMARCGTLEKISLTWAYDELLDPTSDEYGPKSVEQLRKDYRLDSLVACRKLKDITLKTWHGYDESVAVLSGLKGWFEENWPAATVTLV